MPDAAAGARRHAALGGRARPRSRRITSARTRRPTSSCSTRRYVPADGGAGRLRRACRSRRAGRCSRRVLDLTPRIHADFRYDPTATTVATPLDEVLRAAPRRLPGLRPPRRSAACARSASPPATSAATCAPRRRRASRAWSAPTPRTPGSSVFCPGLGWIDLDPDQRPGPRRPAHHRSPGAATTATSARSRASSSAAASTRSASPST